MDKRHKRHTPGDKGTEAENVKDKGPSVKDEGHSVKDEGPSVIVEGPSVKDEGSDFGDEWSGEGSSLKSDGSSLKSERSSVRDREGSSVTSDGFSVKDAGPSVKSERCSVKSKKLDMERNGPSGKDERPGVKSEGPSDKSEGPSDKSEGPIDKSEGSGVKADKLYPELNEVRFYEGLDVKNEGDEASDISEKSTLHSQRIAQEDSQSSLTIIHLADSNVGSAISSRTLIKSTSQPADMSMMSRITSQKSQLWMIASAAHTKLKHGCFYPVTEGYSKYLARFAFIPIIVIFLLVVAMAWSSYHYHPPPDFSGNPTKGFEVRGTGISNAQLTLKRLNNMLIKGDKLMVSPSMENITDILSGNLDLLFAQSEDGPEGIVGDMQLLQGKNNTSEGVGSGGENHTLGDQDQGLEDNGEDQKHTYEDDDGLENGGRLQLLEDQKLGDKGLEDEEDIEVRKRDRCHCKSPSCLVRNPLFVFEAVAGIFNFAKPDLFTPEAMQSMCRIQEEVIYPQTPEDGKVHCDAVSFPNLIASRANKTCFEIDQLDLNNTRDIIEECGDDPVEYKNHSKTNLTTNTYGFSVHICSLEDREYVTNILTNVAQKGFFDEETKTIGRLEYSGLYLMGYYEDELKFFRKTFERRQVRDRYVKITAVKFANHFKLKNELLGIYLVTDLAFFGFALVLIFSIMLVYLRSVVLVIFTIINVFASFVTAYFLFYFVFRMKFFPYLNLLAALVLIAVGADDMFIVYDCWSLAQSENPNAPINRLLEEMFYHATLSIVVTSLTTASAFFANAISHIIALRTFAIFAGISILVNVVYVLTLIPAVIVCVEMVYRFHVKSSKLKIKKVDATIDAVIGKFHQISVLIFHKGFPYIVATRWYVFIFIFLLQGIGASVALFGFFKFELPDSKLFELFPRSNVIQNWESKMESQFQSVEVNKKDWELIKSFIVFGIKANDPSDQLNPDDKGEDIPVTLDPKFNMTQNYTQVFIYNLCKDVIKASFIDEGPEYRCHFDVLLQVLEARCSDEAFQAIGCCPKNFTIPLDEAIFQRCAGIFEVLVNKATNKTNLVPPTNDTTGDGINTHALDSSSIVGDFVFRGNDSAVVAYTMYVQTNLVPSFNYEIMNSHDKAMRGFLDSRKALGPDGVQKGFVVYTDYFWFYDLQLALKQGTLYSIVCSLAVACGVMLLTSRNPLLTLYAMVTIGFSIASTVVVLVALGWQLNIMESMIISLAVGLSIDFTVHYGIAYRLSLAKSPMERTKEGFRKVGSAVTLAALTTFVAGAAVMPCQVLIYVKLGTFLMLLMTFSWLYSNFFFQSLCHIIGPSDECYDTFITRRINPLFRPEARCRLK